MQGDRSATAWKGEDGRLHSTPYLRAVDGALQEHAAPTLQVLCQWGRGGPDGMRERLGQWWVFGRDSR